MATGTMKANGWKRVGDTTGDALITLPDGWSELLVQISGGSNNNFLTSLFCSSMTTNSLLDFSGGSYGTSWGLVQISKTQARLKQLNWGGTNITATAWTYWFYK